MTRPQTKKCRWPLETEKVKEVDFSLKPSEENLADILILGPLSSRTLR